MTAKKAGTSPNGQRSVKGKPRRLIIFAVLLLFFLYLMVSIGLIYLKNKNAEASGIGKLPVSIRASSVADYSQDPTNVVFPHISKNILHQIITEIPGTGNPQDRLGTLEPALLTPVPSMTPEHDSATPVAPPFTPTLTPIHTAALTTTQTATLTPTNTPTLTPIHTATLTTTQTSTLTRTNTPTLTPTGVASETASATPTYTSTPAGVVACSSNIYNSPIYFNAGTLLADINNNFGSAIMITALHLDWQDAGPTRLEFIQLGGKYIWDKPGSLYDDSPPTDIAVSGSEFSWDSDNGARTIDAGLGSMATLSFAFDPGSDLPAGPYTLRVTFDDPANCYIQTSITKP